MSLFLAFLLRCSAASPDEEAACSNNDVEDKSQDADEEDQDVQAVVLVPGQAMGGHPQVLGPLVAHHKLDPEDSLVRRLHQLIMVDSGKPHDALFVPDRRN